MGFFFKTPKKHAQKSHLNGVEITKKTVFLIKENMKFLEYDAWIVRSYVPAPLTVTIELDVASISSRIII